MDEQTPAPWAPPTPPADTPRRDGRRGPRFVVGALAVIALGGAAFVAVGQLGGDDAEATTDATGTDGDDDGEVVPGIDDLTGSLGDTGTCLAEELGLDVPTSAEDLGDVDLDSILDSIGALTPDELTAAWEACSDELDDVGTWLGEIPGLDQLPDPSEWGDELGGDWGDLDAVLDGVVECLGPVVQDLAPESGGEPGAADATVTVVGPDGVTVYSLGEGDGSVTVTRDGGAVTVESTGDVAELDVEATVDEGIAALEACDLGLPFDLEIPDVDWSPDPGD